MRLPRIRRHMYILLIPSLLIAIAALLMLIYLMTQF